MTVAELVARARERLLAAGVPTDEAPGDAEVLARHVLGWDLTRYAIGRRDAPPADFAARYDALIDRRITREPVSQIVGHREFWGLDFEVTRDVLTPRPETELVVRAVLDVCRGSGTIGSAPVIADIGTGSGCIAVALASELPQARFIATDVSPAALRIARRNAARHGVADRITFMLPRQDTSSLLEKLSVVASNPPYIPLTDRSSLPPEVRDHEPGVALFGGDDGLGFYWTLFEHVPAALLDGGRLVVEVGYDQAARVEAIADPRVWKVERTYRDLQNIERVLVFRRHNP